MRYRDRQEGNTEKDIETDMQDRQRNLHRQTCRIDIERYRDRQKGRIDRERDIERARQAG